MNAFINQAAFAEQVSPEQLDQALAQGWRHFGSHFFRYERSLSPRGWQHVLPLRLELTEFHPSASQRRIWKRNVQLEVQIAPAQIDPEAEALFQRHKRRFRQNIPESIYTFMSEHPASLPCENQRISVYQNGALIAAHYLDIGATSTSSVTAFYEPSLARASLGIYTILLAITHSQALGKTHYYPGYAHREPSVYDYKKRLGKLYAYDWRGSWRPLEAGES